MRLNKILKLVFTFFNVANRKSGITCDSHLWLTLYVFWIGSSKDQNKNLICITVC